VHEMCRQLVCTLLYLCCCCCRCNDAYLYLSGTAQHVILFAVVMVHVLVRSLCMQHCHHQNACAEVLMQNLLREWWGSTQR
jgi:hypothetical protein